MLQGVGVFCCHDNLHGACLRMLHRRMRPVGLLTYRSNDMKELYLVVTDSGDYMVYGKSETDVRHKVQRLTYFRAKIEYVKRV